MENKGKKIAITTVLLALTLSLLTVNISASVFTEDNKWHVSAPPIFGQDFVVEYSYNYTPDGEQFDVGTFLIENGSFVGTGVLSSDGSPRPLPTGNTWLTGNYSIRDSLGGVPYYSTYTGNNTLGWFSYLDHTIYRENGDLGYSVACGIATSRGDLNINYMPNVLKLYADEIYISSKVAYTYNDYYESYGSLQITNYINNMGNNTLLNVTYEYDLTNADTGITAHNVKNVEVAPSGSTLKIPLLSSAVLEALTPRTNAGGDEITRYYRIDNLVVTCELGEYSSYTQDGYANLYIYAPVVVGGNDYTTNVGFFDTFNVMSILYEQDAIVNGTGYYFGYEEGYDKGELDGYQSGFDDGYQEGYSDAEGASQEQIENAYTRGYSAGYNKAFEDIKNQYSGIDISFVDWITTAIGGFFDLQIYPGLTIGGILGVIIAILFFVVFLKLFAGG